MGADVVLDASAGVRIALADGFGAFGQRRLAAPTLLWSEAASALRQLEWRGQILRADVSAALAALGAAPIEFHDSRRLVNAAVELAGRAGWAKTYDAEYVVLARELGLPLLTVDSKLRRAVHDLVRTLDPLDVT